MPDITLEEYYPAWSWIVSKPVFTKSCHQLTTPLWIPLLVYIITETEAIVSVLTTIGLSINAESDELKKLEFLKTGILLSTWEGE